MRERSRSVHASTSRPAPLAAQRAAKRLVDQLVANFEALEAERAATEALPGPSDPRRRKAWRDKLARLGDLIAAERAKADILRAELRRPENGG